MIVDKWHAIKCTGNERALVAFVCVRIVANSDNFVPHIFNCLSHNKAKAPTTTTEKMTKHFDTCVCGKNEGNYGTIICDRIESGWGERNACKKKFLKFCKLWHALNEKWTFMTQTKEQQHTLRRIYGKRKMEFCFLTIYCICACFFCFLRCHCWIVSWSLDFNLNEKSAEKQIRIHASRHGSGISFYAIIFLLLNNGKTWCSSEIDFPPCEKKNFFPCVDWRENRIEAGLTASALDMRGRIPISSWQCNLSLCMCVQHRKIIMSCGWA